MSSIYWQILPGLNESQQIFSIILKIPKNASNFSKMRRDFFNFLNIRQKVPLYLLAMLEKLNHSTLVDFYQQKLLWLCTLLIWSILLEDLDTCDCLAESKLLEILKQIHPDS